VGVDYYDSFSWAAGELSEEIRPIEEYEDISHHCPYNLFPRVGDLVDREYL
jgi:hypothetical protein